MSELVRTRPGTLTNGKMLIPELPGDAATLAEQRQILLHSLGAIDLMGYVAARAHALGVVHYDPQADREVGAELAREASHQRELAERRRRREIAEADQEVLKAEQEAIKLEQATEALVVFKPEKFKSGFAGFEKRRAQTYAERAEARFKESVATEEAEIIEPEQKAAPRSQPPDLGAYFAIQIEELQAQIDRAAADGKPTEELRAQEDVLNRLLRKELLKGRQP
jgi:hypothetical protein